MKIRIQLTAENTISLLHTGSLQFADLDRRVRSSIIAKAIEFGIPLKEGGTIANPQEAIAAINALPLNPTIEEWSAMTISQRETYSDEIFFDMESRMI